MATNLVHYELDGAPHWGVASASGIAPLDGAYPTTAALIEHGEADWRRASARAPSVSFDSALILSPVTTPCRIYCQGANYRQHMIESGMDPDAKAFNMFFTKSDASIASAKGTVTPPKHVSLLDYEVELAMIFRRPIVSAVTVTRENLKNYVFAVAIANDFSARDVQLPQMQFFKGKSYRGFCPIGPWLTVPEPDEFPCLDDLELLLTVNDAVRQRDSTRNSRIQAGRDDFRIVHLRQYRARRRAADGNAQRLRPPPSAGPGSPHRPAPARTPVLEAVPEFAAAQG